MEAPETYITILQSATGNYSESGSKFLGYSFAIVDESEIKILRDQLSKEHHKAVHVAFAARLGFEGENERSSDDGEPSGSAGKPILNELKSRALTQTCVLIVRYFGGKKLGIPGLIHAYRAAAIDCLNNSGTKEVVLYDDYEISCHMDHMPVVLHELNKSGARVIDSEFAENCNFKIEIPRTQHAAFTKTLQNLWQATATYIGMH